MASKPARIFISYRRSDSRSDARSLRRELERSFSPEEIFRDIENIEYGEDIAEVIFKQIEVSQIVLVLIGPNWLKARTQDGRRRIDQSDDYVRMEIESAAKLGKRVIPIYIDETPILRREDLPHQIEFLSHLSSHRLRDETYESDIIRLVSALPGTELTLFRVVGGAALGGFLCDVIIPLIRYGLISPGGSRFAPTPLLASPLIEGVRYGLLAFCIFGALRGVLRISYERIRVASAWIALAAFGSEVVEAALVRPLIHEFDHGWMMQLANLAGNIVRDAILGFYSGRSFLRARGSSLPPVRRCVWALTLFCVAAQSPYICLYMFGPKEYWSPSQHPFVLSCVQYSLYRTFSLTGCIVAFGGLQAWGRSFVIKIALAIGLGSFSGMVVVQIYRTLVYFNQEISGTFDPQFVFIYSSIALAIFLVLVRSQPKGNVLYHPTFVKITLALMIGCIPGAFYLKWKGFVDPPQERDLRMLESRIDSLLDKLEEKGVITTDEASVLRQ